MPILIFITFAIILYVIDLELKETKQRHIADSWLAIAATVGLVVSFGILIYLVGYYVPVEDAFPGSGNLTALTGR